jgi:hypothetical protein
MGSWGKSREGDFYNLKSTKAHLNDIYRIYFSFIYGYKLTFQ